MSMNTEKTFDLEGNDILRLLGEIQQVQSLSDADVYTKLMLADNTDALSEASRALQKIEGYNEDRAAILAAVYPVKGYLLTPEQVPKSATVQQIRGIRSFIKTQ